MKKIISFVSLLGLLLNSFVAPLSVVAQEATSNPTPDTTIISTDVATPLPDLSVIDLTTPLPEITPTPGDESTPTPTDQAIVENVSSTETEPQVAEPSATLITPEPQPIEKVYLSDGQIVIDTSNSEWNVEGNTAETKEPVRLGVKYVFPLETGVTLTFKSLPANESLRTTIKIAKVKVSDLNLPDDMKPYGEYAYDITTGMTNGTFDYDVTLPKPDNQNVDVAYMEDKNSAPTALASNQTTQENTTVKASDIDHFTIFVVINPTPTGPACVLAGATTGTGCYSTIQAAIDASANGDVIEIQSDITVGQRVNANKDVTINGNGFTVNPTFTKTDNSNNAVFGVTSSGVTISNLVIDGALGTNLHGINVYVSTGVLLDGVSVLNNDYAGIVVNGSIVTVNNIVTSGNGWGGINVDQGSGVTSEARLIINGISSHNEAIHIWLDDTTKNVSVQDTNPKQYTYQDYGNRRVYTLKAAGNPSADLDQWGNEDPVSWQNGNLNDNQADYFEGDSVAYRMKFDNLSLSSHTVTIGWDTTKGGKHALDYLTSYDRTETTDPCFGISGCIGPASTYAIPIDINIPADSNWTGSQIPGNFSLFGGTITGVSSYNLINSYSGDSETQITITFTASQNNPVLAWGGHIATRGDWGQNNSAVSISGSPYHMRLRGLDGSGGNQDRSLASGAVIYPASITIIKDAIPNNAQDFSFTTSGTELSGFSLDDDSDTTLSNTKVFSITSFASSNGDTKTITEDPQSGWSLTGLVCDDNNGYTDPVARTATLSVVEGENITCTFTNTQQNGTLRVNKITVPNEAEVFSITATGSGTITGNATQNVTGGSFVDYTVTTGTYSVTETPTTGWDETNNTCTNVLVPAGGRGECAITNTQRGSIFGYKYEDVNGDGQTGDWTPVVGWVMELWQNNSKVGQTQTISGGYYEFTNRILGSYEVREQVSGGWTNITQLTLPITLTAGENDGPNNFVNFNLGHISGHKWNDLNGDGDWDKPDEPSIEGWTIYATYPDLSTHSTTTDSSGYYSFSDLGPGQYIIYETPPTGWAQTFPMSSYVINMTSGGDFENNDFGNQIRGTITIIKDAIPNSTQDFVFTSTQLNNFTLDDDSGGKITNTEVFSNKGNGTYSITESLVSGWKLTDIVCEGDSDAQWDIDNRTVTLTINEPGENITCTFTNTKYGYMQGRKYLDNNLNGRLDWAESGTFQDGWTIRLYDNNWQLKETQLTRILMDPSGGQYRFENLLPGTYYACEVLPTGWQQMGPVLGSHAVNYDNTQVNSSIAVANGSGVLGEAPVCWQSIVNGDEFGWLGFGNIQKGHIIVDKVTEPLGELQSFDFTATGSGYINFSLTDQDEPNNQELLPGVYGISEMVPQGWDLESVSCVSSIKDSESVSRLELDAGETITCTFNNLKLDPKITITKSNNSSGGILAGTTVTYTINLKNDGNVYIYDIDITDILPGGFMYVAGTTTGVTTNDPVIVGGTLTWNDVGDLDIGELLTISYQAKVGVDISNGTYTNIASCGAKYGKKPEIELSLFAVSQTDSQENVISCRTASSTVTIGSTQGYGGNLVGQVLGISTELPATGNPTWVLIAAFAALGAGIFLNVYAKKKTKNVKK